MWKTYHTKNITESYLFRFLTIHHLSDFLKTGNIWFARADQFLDQMECAYVEDLINALDTSRINARKRRFLVSCWSVSDHESIGLWNQFHAKGHERRTVAIRFKREYLIKLVKELFHANHRFYHRTNFHLGKVSYRQLAGATPELLEKARISYPFFRKEQAFDFEREFRFVVEFHKEDNEAPKGFGYRIGKPNHLEFEILINPLLNKAEHLEIEEIIQSLGFKNKLMDSALRNWFKQE